MKRYWFDRFIQFVQLQTLPVKFRSVESWYEILQVKCSKDEDYDEEKLFFKMPILWSISKNKTVNCCTGRRLSVRCSSCQLVPRRTDVNKVYHMYIERSICTLVAFCRRSEQLMLQPGDHLQIDQHRTCPVIVDLRSPYDILKLQSNCFYNSLQWFTLPGE